ncbi:phosphate ABC transporter substrate-binding/OmpA family protein [Pseudaestuariivita rosea]|uniref:phosphate ABC transporter substrate-binding/OmpA family protein n=1 Tax=Pseudaestuariivita rosea TaxID=2763263 RepID=UPI001F40FACD|nr:phosphate ABC transporter substrate-binding/OmpA family protein [Pseudaestuariivita rosea]
MRKTSLAALLAGTFMTGLAATAALADRLTLRATDESLSVTGELISFDGQTYTLQTTLGVVSVPAGLVICSGPACPNVNQATEFTIVGSQSLGQGLIPALFEAYSENVGADFRFNSGNSTSTIEMSGSAVADVTVEKTNSTSGLRALLDEDATFALSTRPARNRELRNFEAAGLGTLNSGAQEHIVALDGLVLITAPGNPVRAISEANAALAFGGVVTNWADLGGRNAPINVHVREPDSGAREVFDALVMRPNGYAVDGRVTVHTSDEDLVQAVLNDPNGIGFTSFANVGNAGALAIEGVCGLQTPPSAFAIKTEEYPLTRLLYMYQTNKPLPEHARGLRDFALSDAAQSIVANAGFIDQAVTSESINAQGLRIASALVAPDGAQSYEQLREMVDLLISADRLSTTYRFRTGSADLNARAQADVERLIELMQGQDFTNKELLFVGFTDSVGQADLNRELSQQRAEQVMQAIRNAAPNLSSRVRMRAIGFGEISPLGCNETNTGRLINRRVEVWVQDIVAN